MIQLNAGKNWIKKLNPTLKKKEKRVVNDYDFNKLRKENKTNLIKS
jgi:hypothetical protein